MFWLSITNELIMNFVGQDDRCLTQIIKQQVIVLPLHSIPFKSNRDVMVAFPTTKHLWQILKLCATRFDLSIKNYYLEIQSSQEVHNARENLCLSRKCLNNKPTQISIKLMRLIKQVQSLNLYVLLFALASFGTFGNFSLITTSFGLALVKGWFH